MGGVIARLPRTAHACVHPSCALRRPFVVVGVFRDKGCPLRWDGSFLENRSDRTGSFTGSTIDALVGIDKQVFRFLKSGLVWSGMDTINGTDIDTGSIFDPDAGERDDIGH